ncbi:MAG: B12-binding domain-containing radical SAM protein [Candidatus Geothermincolia bacterium]
MRVLFVHSEEDHYSTEKPLEGHERMQFGISYISSLLKREGHSTRLAVPTRATSRVLEEHIADFDPDLVCFTCVYTEFAFISELARRVKEKHPDLFLLIGGPHASLKPDDCLAAAFDAVCIGEGEYPTLELVDQLENGDSPSGILNMHIKHDGEIERNEQRPFLTDLDSLPFPDREMWLPWIANQYSRPSVLLGRGCPFQCTYCCNHALARLSAGKYVRLRSHQNVIDEILDLKATYPYLSEVYLEVETLGFNQEWAIELCGLLEKMNADLEIPIAFGSNLRITPRTEYHDLFTAFKSCGFRFVNIGLESGSERLRREVLKRNMSNEDIIGAVRSAKEHGLEVGIYNLIGIPGETRKDFRETIKVTRACQPDWFLLSVFFPYPGTVLHEKCRELGLLDKPVRHGFERRKPLLGLPGFSKRQVGRRYTWSHFLFYAGHRPAREIARQVALTKIYTNPTLLGYYRAVKKNAAR